MWIHITLKSKGKHNMKKQLILLVLCLIGTMSTLPAQEVIPNNGYEKFSQCRLYYVDANSNTHRHFEEIYEKIDSLTSRINFFDDNNIKFDLKKSDTTALNLKYNMVVWDGYLYSEKAGTYTFMISSWTVPFMNNYHGAFGITVNDKNKVVKDGQKNVYQDILDADLKVGYNKIRFCFFVYPTVAVANPGSPYITYKPRNVVANLIPIKPAMLYHKAQKEDW